MLALYPSIHKPNTLPCKRNVTLSNCRWHTTFLVHYQTPSHQDLSPRLKDTSHVTPNHTTQTHVCSHRLDDILLTLIHRIIDFAQNFLAQTCIVFNLLIFTNNLTICLCHTGVLTNVQFTKNHRLSICKPLTNSLQVTVPKQDCDSTHFGDTLWYCST